MAPPCICRPGATPSFLTPLFRPLLPSLAPPLPPCRFICPPFAPAGHAHDLNEPGGRLFGEPIRAPGERRVWFDWEYAQYAGMGSAVVLLVVGLGSRPGKTYKVRAAQW